MQDAGRIDGYGFSAEAVREVVGHNRRLTRGPVSWGQLPNIKTVFISVPRCCNLRCLYCYTDSGIVDAHGLSHDEIQRVVNTVAAMGAESVVVAGEGEPFLTPNIWTIIEAAAKREMTCVVFTNGTFITRDVAGLLLKSRVSVILKLNSFRPSTQDRLVGVEGAHKAMYAALDSLLAVGFRAPRFALQSAIMRPILDDLRDIFVFCRARNIVPYIETFVAMGRGATESVRRELEPSPDEVERFFTEMQEIDRIRFGIEWPGREKLRVVGYGACNKSQIAITVKANGDVLRCITELTRLGNIRRSDLRDIMRSEGVVRALVDERCSGCASLCLNCHVSQHSLGAGVIKWSAR